MFFSDMETGEFLSEFHVGDVRPSSAAGEYCSAHMGMTTMDRERDLLVNAWYTGGVNVIDFSEPTRLKEIAYYDRVAPGGTWSAYPYTGPRFATGPGIPVYASDGVTSNGLSEGMVTYRTLVGKPGKAFEIDHLNPQTMDFVECMGGIRARKVSPTQGGAAAAAPPSCGYFRSRAQTAAAWTLRRRPSSAASGAGMLRVVVTERRPPAVAATHSAYPGKSPVWP